MEPKSDLFAADFKPVLERNVRKERLPNGFMLYSAVVLCNEMRFYFAREFSEGFLKPSEPPSTTEFGAKQLELIPGELRKELIQQVSLWLLYGPFEEEDENEPPF